MSPQTASANSWPPAGVILLDLPLIASIASFGIGLLFIIGVESITLAKREHLSRFKCIQISTVANLFSTVVGLFFVLGLASLPYASLNIYLMLGLFFLLLGALSTHFLKRIHLQAFSWHPIVWGTLWFLSLFLESILIKFINSLNWQTVTVPIFSSFSIDFHTNSLQIVAFVIFLSVGFFLSLVSEGFCIVRFLSQPSSTLGMTILVMNLRSYAYVAIPITLGLWLWPNIH
ncbi:hypothetical protein [Allocoleopsis sp.]|uniref:hypothetical protein n=1 Tax=Allocoleopsis sp. TaxID=3088169 RepID=UPI002FCEFF0D